MKIDKSIIAPKLTKLKSFLPGKGLEAAIQGVLLKNNCLIATNTEVKVTTTIETDTDETFIITAKAIDLIENLPDGPIEIIPEDNYSIRIKAKSINNKFQSYNPAEFADQDSDMPDTVAGTIYCKDLEKAMKSVMYAVSTNTLKPIFTGIYFNSVAGKLNLVGCDGYRLAWSRMDYANEFSFVVPKESVQKLISIGTNGDISIAYNQKNAIFKTEEYTVYTRLLEGTYLDYEKMFVKKGNTTTVNRMSLLESIKRCMICMENKSKSSVKLQMDEEKLIITGNSEISQYSEEINLVNPIDEPLTIAFNGSFMLDFLKTFDSENLECSFGTDVQPLIIEDGEQSALILLIRLGA